MNNNRFLLIVAAAAIGILALAAAKPAFGADIYNGFENPPFVPGPLVGQDDWEGVPILSPQAAVITTDLPYQGLQSVRVWGGDLEHQGFINSKTHRYYDAIGSYRH